MTKENLPIPDYVIQPNAISQAIYSCSTNARKLMAMAMSLIPMQPDKKNRYKVKFTVSEFLKALDIKDGTRTRELTKSAVKECTEVKLLLKNTLDEYVGYNWFSTWSFSWGLDVIELTFNQELGDFIAQLKGQAKLDLIDMGKLQSKYAIRFYELAMSYAGFSGKGENNRNEWYFERELNELKTLFQIEQGRYKITADFRKDVVDRPIAELNAADVGFKISIDYIRKGKRLLGFRFLCRKEDKQTGKIASELPLTLTEKENAKLEKLYPEEFQKLYQQEVNQTPLFPQPETMHELAAKSKAIDALRKKHGVKKG